MENSGLAVKLREAPCVGCPDGISPIVPKMDALVLTITNHAVKCSD